LNHAPGLVADGQGDCAASAAPCSKRLVGHKAFFSGYCRSWLLAFP
jgi:hypothetical protein